MGRSLAVVGATGAVGEEILAILDEREFAIDALRLFSSPRSAGRRIPFRGQEIEVEALAPGCFKDTDIALFSAGGGISREWAPAAVEEGARVVDNSSAFRMDEGVPLVIPEINGALLKDGPKLIANPNCTTIILLMGIAPIHRRYGIARGVIATYQAASGAGRKAMEELRDQTRRVLDDEPYCAEAFPAPIAFNLIPHCDLFLDDGFTKEEAKVVNESRKILGEPGLKLTVTAVRVPILRAHSEAVALELERDFELDEVAALLRDSPGLRLMAPDLDGNYPMPVLASGGDPVLAGRLRRDPTCERGLMMFLCGDQLRKGAALNAVQIAEALEVTR